MEEILLKTDVDVLQIPHICQGTGVTKKVLEDNLPEIRTGCRNQIEVDIVVVIATNTPNFQERELSTIDERFYSEGDSNTISAVGSAGAYSIFYSNRGSIRRKRRNIFSYSAETSQRSELSLTSSSNRLHQDGILK
jgi:hypothetical protein